MANLPAPVGGGTGYEWPGLGILGTSLAMFGGGATGGSQGYRSRTLLCTLPCAPASSWTDANKNLVTPPVRVRGRLGRGDVDAVRGGRRGPGHPRGHGREDDMTETRAAGRVLGYSSTTPPNRRSRFW